MEFTPKMQRLIQSELQSFEQISWSGSPKASRMAVKTLPILLFGIPWTAFALFWMAGASGFKIPDFSQPTGFFSLFGVPFVLIGTVMLSSPLWVMRKAASTAYVITTSRALIFSPGAFGSVGIQSFLPDQLTGIRRVQLPDGSGDIIFGKKYSTDSEGSSTITDIGFFGVPDVKRVEERIRALASTVRAGGDV